MTDDQTLDEASDLIDMLGDLPKDCPFCGATDYKCWHTCIYCGETIAPHERMRNMPFLQMHRECSYRCIVGSVAHQQKKCTCFVPEEQGGLVEGDPPHLSLRDAARLAYAYGTGRCP